MKSKTDEECTSTVEMNEIEELRMIYGTMPDNRHLP